jgi:hypothetical protein
MKMWLMKSIASKSPRLFATVNFSPLLLAVSLLATSACGGAAVSKSNAALRPVITVDEDALVRPRYYRPARDDRFVIAICAMTVGSSTSLPECTGTTPRTPCATKDGWIFSGGDQVQFGLMSQGICTIVGPDGPEAIRSLSKNRDIAH